MKNVCKVFFDVLTIKVINIKKETQQLHVTIWLWFVFITGCIVFVIMSKSRYRSYQTMNVATTDRIAYENRNSEECIQRGRYANYFIAVFAFDLVLTAGYETLVLDMSMKQSWLGYSFGVFWILLTWLINRHQMKKHQYNLEQLK